MKTIFEQSLKIFLFALIILSYGLVKAQMHVNGISITISEGGDIVVSDNFIVKSDVIMKNDGKIYLSSFAKDDKMEVLFEIQEVDGTKGKFYLSGAGIINWYGDKARLNNLVVDTDVKCIQSLEVANSLELSKGLVEVADNEELLLLNSDENSLKIGQGAVKGNFSRAIKTSSADYLFPVGMKVNNVIKTYMFKLSKPNNNDIATVNYLDSEINYNDLPSNLVIPYVTSIWRVNCTHQNTSFISEIDIKTFMEDKLEKLGKDYNIEQIYVRDRQDGNQWKIVPTEFKESVIKTLLRYHSGDYAIFTDKDINVVNAILVDGVNDSIFAFPVSDEIVLGRLTMVDHQGSLIYYSNEYKNDFDMANLKAGTYYYSINYTFNGRPMEMRKFVELIKK